MTRSQDHPDRTATKSTVSPRLETEADDQWLADLPNDLGALSLSTDEAAPVRLDEMGYVDVHKTRPHRHGDCGL